MSFRTQIQYKAASFFPNIDIQHIQDFLLKNPLKLEPELLKEVAKHHTFQQALQNKCPEWLPHIAELIAPERINMEQASSHLTAIYKSQLIEFEHGIDLSGGVGIDSYFMAKKAIKWAYNEPHFELFQLVKHNFETLRLQNVQFINVTAEKFTWNKNYDLVYVDPSRRDERKNTRFFKIEDCLPDLVELQHHVLPNTKYLMSKFAPFLDISQAISLLKHVKEVHVLSENNEVKELLFIQGQQLLTPEPKIFAINFVKGVSQTFQNTFSAEKLIVPHYGISGSFLYEPNAAILKAGLHKSPTQWFDVQKMAPNSHLFTSNQKIDQWPGRCFKIEKIQPYNSKKLMRDIPGGKANITVRNFPLTVAEIRKQTKIKEGGNIYLFFSENNAFEKIVIICRKLN